MIKMEKKFFWKFLVLFFLSYSLVGEGFAKNLNQDSSLIRAEKLLSASYTLIKTEPEKAIIFLKEAQFIFKNKSRYRKYVDCILALAEIHIRLSDYDIAYSLLTNATSVSLERNFLPQHIMALSSLGRLSSYLGEYDRAIGYLNDGLELAKQNHLQNQEMFFKATIAYIQIYFLKDRSQASLKSIKDLYERAMKVPVDTLLLLSTGIYMGGASYWVEGNVERAVFYYKQCLDLANRSGDLFRASLIMNNMGEVLFEAGKVDEAEQIFTTSFKYASVVKSKLLLYNCYKHLSNCAESKGDFKLALTLFRSFEQLRQEVLNEDLIRKTREIHSLYQLERKGRENDRIKNEKLINQKESETKIRTYQAIVFVFILAIIFASVLVYFDRKRLNESLLQKSIIEEQNQLLMEMNKDLRDQRQFVEEASIEADNAIKSKIDFFSIITHELRTPLNAVVGTVQLLQDDNPNDSQQRSINILKFSADNLLNLINDILDFNKIEAGKVELEQNPFSLSGLLYNIKNSLQMKAHEKGIELRLRLDKNLPKAFIGDRLRLGQVFYNLIANAIKFTEKGFVEIEVRYYPTNSDQNIWFGIKDTGIGIPEDQQKGIFDFFSQADSSIGRKFGGSGLGLTISKNLLQLMGSSIQLESKPKQGSKFSFSLNLAVTSIDLPDEAAQLTEEESTVFLDSRILLVEDDDVNREVLVQFLQKWKLNFDVANCGEKAIDLANMFGYNLILMDLQLPDLDGFKTSEAIRGIRKNANTTILAMTASPFSEVKEQLEIYRINGYLPKPFISNELRNAIFFWINQDYNKRQTHVNSQT